VARPVISPDGRRAVVRIDRKSLMLSTDGAAPEPFTLVGPGEGVASWSADGQSLFVVEHNAGVSVVVSRMNLATGTRTPWKTLAPGDRAGLLRTQNVRISADGTSYAYSYERMLGELFVVDGLR